MKDTTIGWTDTSWNPVNGCQRISPGCENCYAERMAARFSKPGLPYERLVRVLPSGPRWTGVVIQAFDHLHDPLAWVKGRRIFVSSMSDLFHDDQPNEYIAAVFGVMSARCQRSPQDRPTHTFQVLTKRAKRMRAWFEWVALEGRKRGMSPNHVCLGHAGDALGSAGQTVWSTHCYELTRYTQSWPLQNVWLGVSVEDQQRADERVPELLATPAAVRFLSCEPMLGPVELQGIPADVELSIRDEVWSPRGWLNPTNAWGASGKGCPRIDWVISGCESGPGARPCDVEWLRSLRNQCAAAGVAYFLKQAFELELPGIRVYPSAQAARNPPTKVVAFGAGATRKGKRLIELPYLDGVQHAAFPGDAR